MEYLTIQIKIKRLARVYARPIGKLRGQMIRHTPQRKMFETFLSAPAHRILDWLAPQSGDDVSDVGRLALKLEEPQDPKEIV